MGGDGIFRVSKRPQSVGDSGNHDPARRKGNSSWRSAILPQIVDGDKRVLVIDGEPVPGAWRASRKPGETRGNLAAGGAAKRVVSARDREIARRWPAPGKPTGCCW